MIGTSLNSIPGKSNSNLTQFSQESPLDSFTPTPIHGDGSFPPVVSKLSQIWMESRKELKSASPQSLMGNFEFSMELSNFLDLDFDVNVELLRVSEVPRLFGDSTSLFDRYTGEPIVRESEFGVSLTPYLTYFPKN